MLGPGRVWLKELVFWPGLPCPTSTSKQQFVQHKQSVGYIIFLSVERGNAFIPLWLNVRLGLFSKFKPKRKYSARLFGLDSIHEMQFSQIVFVRGGRHIATMGESKRMGSSPSFVLRRRERFLHWKCLGEEELFFTLGQSCICR